MARADALAVMAESFIAHGVESMSGGDKFQIVVHVSAETLSSNSVRPEQAGDGRRVEGSNFYSEFENGPAIAAETARRLACDCSVVHMLEENLWPVAGSLSPVAADFRSTPLDVGRKTRSISPVLGRALNSRDRGCRFPGCCNKRYTHRHHVEHWANGGETKLKNLITLCYFHHRLVHEGGWNVQILDDSAFRFLKPNGEALDTSMPMNRDSDASRVTRHALRVTPSGAMAW